MRKEFIVERQGRAFCLYAGLLDLAHQQGLKSIATQLVQAPTETNNRIAICSATVILENEGVERTFTGIGDAAPGNVAPAMQSCLLRMAETRAKARALRDAVNIGVAAFEELGEEDAHDGAPERGYAAGPARNGRPDRPAGAVRPPSASAPVRHPVTPSALEPARAAEPDMASTGEAPAPGSDVATESQIEAIRNLSQRRSVDPDALAREKYQAASLRSVTHAQASELIRELNGRPAARGSAVGVARSGVSA